MNTGLVVVAHRNRVVIQTACGQQLTCARNAAAQEIVVGDDVSWAADPNGGGIIEQVLPRKSVLTRAIPGRGEKAVAANVNPLVLVIAPKPRFVLTQIDRYLVVAEHSRLRVLLLLNKTDLLDKDSTTLLDQQLEVYRSIGYEQISISTHTGDGVAELNHRLAGKRPVLAGQSGVGKSSIIRVLTGNKRIAVGATSQRGGRGRHTTSASTLYPLAGGGHIIDTPGVQDFSAWHIPDAELGPCFADFRPWLDRCRFDNCKHLAEPDCAVKAAVHDGHIRPERFSSYQAMLAESG